MARLEAAGPPDYDTLDRIDNSASGRPISLASRRNLFTYIVAFRHRHLGKPVFSLLVC